MYEVSVVMPALNEDGNLDAAIRNVLASFEALHIRGEIVIVNDGSTDGTQAVAERWVRSASIKVVGHQSPQGLGASFWDGVAAAGGEVVTMVPGDGENDAYEILRYLPLMEHVDVVVPFICNTKVRSRVRRLVSRLYVLAINASFGLNVRYYNGTVLYRKSLCGGMRLDHPGFFYQTELLIKSIRAGYLYAEVPCALRQRATGRSKALSLRSLLALSRAYVTRLVAVWLGESHPPIAPDSATARKRAAQDRIQVAQENR